MKKISYIFLLIILTFILNSCGMLAIIITSGRNFDNSFKEGAYETEEEIRVANDLKITQSDGTVKEYGKISFTKLKISFVEISEEEYRLRDKNTIENRHDHKKYLVEIYVSINDSDYILANYRDSSSSEGDQYFCNLELNEYFDEEIVVPIRICYWTTLIEIMVYNYVRIDGEPYYDDASWNEIHIPIPEDETLEEK